MSDQHSPLEVHVARHEMELAAIRHWLRRLYKIACADAPAAHAAKVREHIIMMKNQDPAELTDMPTSGREFIWLQILPEIEALGEEIAEGLDDIAGD